MSRVPLIAMIGLPNSGKSTLLNKISGTRKAIVAKEAHTTRDLNYAETVWEGMYMRLVDTGGLVPDPKDKIQKEIQIRSYAAINEADILVWVIDRRQDPETISDQILQRIWKTNKPVMICINKVDDPNLDRSIGDYARLGGFEFVNVSAVNGYGINELLDRLVEKSEELGFEPGNTPDSGIVEEEVKLKRQRSKEVKLGKDGKYYVVRHQDEQGRAGLYQAVDDEGMPVGQQAVKLKNLVFDIFGVVVQNEPGIVLNQEIQDFIENSDPDVNLYYLSNIEKAEKAILEAKIGLAEVFDGGLASCDSNFSKPQIEFYKEFLSKYRLDSAESLFIDDKEENVEAARAAGMWAVRYEPEVTDLEFEIEQIQSGRIERIPRIPKVLLLGKPNVGKSSLFNAMVGQEVQIVTEVPGTTLSVNDIFLERDTYDYEQDRETRKRYVLLDSTGIRRPGQRTFGAESFATYRTVQSAYEADVIMLILDGSQPLTHQDQVVAGICKEARKGLVVVVNKADLMEDEQRQRFMRDLHHKFQFLKVDSYIFVSAKLAGEERSKFNSQDQRALRQAKFDPRESGYQEITDLEKIWDAVDHALQNRSKQIDPQEVRKLFNYLMKQRPPKKLSNKKRAVIYDLLYTKSEPPTFELLIKDKTSVHWSYIRFLENIIRRQFHFENTGVVVKLTQVDRRRVVG